MPNTLQSPLTRETSKPHKIEISHLKMHYTKHKPLYLPSNSIKTLKFVDQTHLQMARPCFRNIYFRALQQIRGFTTVMLLWVAVFWFIGSWMVPFVGHVAGFSQESLTFRGQALFSLVTDVTEGLAGIMILHHCLSRFRLLPPDWFKFSLKGNWHFDVALGCLMFPLVNQLSQFNLNLLPLLPSTPVTLSSVEQSILACDPIAMALYAIVVSVCAPLRCMLVPFILG
ncbi:hypothetical protein UlMin_011817 [Ulmus minor]